MAITKDMRAGLRLCKTFFRFSALPIWVLAMLPTVALGSDAVLDDFNNNAGWTPGYNGYLYGSAGIENGCMHISHDPEPVTTYHGIWMSKNYCVNFVPNTWIHFRLKEQEVLLGADAYADYYVDGQHIACFGYNGEQHWVQDAYCVAKTWDDEWFIGSSVMVGEVDGSPGTNNDIRVAFSGSLANKVKYSDYHIFSVKYEVIGTERRMRFFVDGRETGYRSLDCYAPTGVVDNHIVSSWQPATGVDNILNIRLSSLTDGNYYADTSVNGGRGVRWAHAFTDYCPAIPHPTIPSLSTKKTSDMYWDYLIVDSPDNVGQIKYQIRDMLYEGRMSVSTAIFLELLSWQYAEIFGQWMSQDEINEVRAHPLGSSTFATHGFISGTIKDLDGNPVAGASVYTAVGGFSTTTGSDGSYFIYTVDPGNYTLYAWKPGYCVSTLHDVAVVQRLTTSANISDLKPGFWEFNNNGNSEGWQSGSGIANVAAANGNLAGDITSQGSYLLGPTDPSMYMCAIQSIQIRMKVTSGSTAKLSWGAADDSEYTSARGIPFQIVPDSQFHDYAIGVSDNQTWSGMLRYLRLYPSDSQSAHFEVDYIRVVQSSALFKGSITINSGSHYTNSPSVMLAISAVSSGNAVNSMRFSNDALIWSSWEPYSTSRNWTIPSGDGGKTVFVQFTDTGGNTSPVYSMSVVLNTATCTIGSIVIGSGATYSSSQSVVLTLGSLWTSGEATGMRFMNSGAAWSDWEPFSTSKQWTLSSGSGNRTVYAQYRNVAGTLSPIYGDSIILDTVAPTAPGKPTYSGAFTNATAVSFAWTTSVDGGGSGLAGYVCQIGSVPGGSDVFDGNIGNTRNKTLTGSYGSRYYCRVRAVDNAGNVSAWAASTDGITIVENIGLSIGVIRTHSDSASVGLSSAIVTAVFGNCFYIEDTGRAAGVRIQPVGGIPSGLIIGSTADIGGSLKTNPNGERFIEATILVRN